MFHILQQLSWKNLIVMKFNKWLVLREDMEVFQVKQAPLEDIFMDSVFLLDGLQWLFISSQVSFPHLPRDISSRSGPPDLTEPKLNGV